jgi:MFS family permease
MTTRIYYGWWLVGAFFLCGLFGNGIVNYCFTSFIEPIASELGWSYVQISFAVSIRGFEIGLGAPVMGWLIDRWGSRKIVFSGTIMLCLGLLLLSQTKDLAVFYAAFILIGLGTTSFTMPIIAIAIGNWFRKHIGIATGIAISGASISGIFVPIVTYIIALYGWRLAVLGILLCIVIVVLPLTLLLRDKPEQFGLLPDGEMKTQGGEHETITAEKSSDHNMSLKQAIRTSGFWQITLVFICLLFIASALVTHIMPYLSSIGIDRYTSSLVAGGVPLLGATGRISMGWFCDRFDKKRLTALLFLIISLALICFALVETIGTWLIVPFVILFGLGYGGGATMASPLTRIWLSGRSFGTIFGLMMGLTQIANITAPPFAGWIYDTWGTYQGFWFLSAGIAGIAAILTMTIAFPKAKE